MAAVEKPVATPKEQAHTVADHLRAKDAGALDELRKDIRGMNPGDQQQFFRQLAAEARNSPNHNLPGLEITEDNKGGLKVKDKGGVLYQEGKSGKPENSTEPAKPGNEQFSPALRKGEGPYQALHRQHPDWNHKQLLDEAHKIKEQTGRKEFKAGEQFRSNPDGSVTSREESKKNDGSYTETNSKDGHKTSVRTGDKDGNWTENRFDPSGKSTGSVERKVGPDGTFKETEKNAEGKVTKEVNGDKNGKNTNTYDKDGNQISAIRENNDGSSVGWKKNADGTQTNFEQKDKDHREETITKDGQMIGSKKMSRDENGQSTDTFDKDGKQIASLRENKDGSSVGWTKNADGTQTNFEQKDKDHRDETITKDGAVIGKRSIVRDDKGVNTNTYDKDGTQTSGLRENKDGTSTGWKKNPDGSTTTTDINANGVASENTFDAKGNMLSSAERNTKTGEYSEKTYKDGKVTLKTHTKNAQGAFVDETRELS